MTKFDAKKVAAVSILFFGVMFIAAAVSIIYGVKILYGVNSGLPGALALVIVGVWVIHDLTFMLNRRVLRHLREIDLAKEDDQ